MTRRRNQITALVLVAGLVQSNLMSSEFGSVDFLHFFRDSGGFLQKDCQISYTISENVTDENIASIKEQIARYADQKVAVEANVEPGVFSQFLEHIGSLQKSDQSGRRKFLLEAVYSRKGNCLKYSEKADIRFASGAIAKRQLTSYDNSALLLSVDPDIRQAIIRPSQTAPSKNFTLFSNIINTNIAGTSLEEFIKQFDQFDLQSSGGDIIFKASRGVSNPKNGEARFFGRVDSATSRVLEISYELYDTKANVSYPIMSRQFTYSNDIPFHYLPASIVETQYGWQLYRGEQKSIPVKTITVSILKADTRVSDEAVEVPKLEQGYSVIDTLTGENFVSGDAFSLIDSILEQSKKNNED